MTLYIYYTLKYYLLWTNHIQTNEEIHQEVLKQVATQVDELPFKEVRRTKRPHKSQTKLFKNYEIPAYYQKILNLK